MDLPPLLRTLAPKTSRERATLRRLRSSIQAALFWSGIALPLLYLPLILTGPETTRQSAAVLALLGAHAVSLLSSHSYEP